MTDCSATYDFWIPVAASVGLLVLSELLALLPDKFVESSSIIQLVGNAIRKAAKGRGGVGEGAAVHSEGVSTPRRREEPYEFDVA